MKTYRTIGLSCLFGCLLLTTAFFVQNFNFNSNQFSANAPYMSIKSGALFTNADEQITAGQFYTVLYPNGTAAFVVSGSGTLQMLDVLGNAYMQYVAGSNSLAINTNLVITGGLTVNSTNPDSYFPGTIHVNALDVTNALITTLSPTSNQTNYTVPLLSRDNVAVIYMANTNAFLTFQNTNQPGYQCTVALRGFTNTITVTWAANLPSMATNLNSIFYVTNGTVRFVNFYNLDTTGTNVVVSDAGTAKHT